MFLPFIITSSLLLTSQSSALPQNNPSAPAAPAAAAGLATLPSDPSGNGEFYPCEDLSLLVFEAPHGSARGLAQYQYNTIRNLQTKFDDAVAALPAGAHFNAEVRTDNEKQGSAGLKPANPKPSFGEAPPVITVKQAAGCVKKLAESVRGKAMASTRLQEREWSVVTRSGGHVYIAKGAYVVGEEEFDVA